MSFTVSQAVQSQSNLDCLQVIAEVAKKYNLPVEVITPVNSAVFDWAPDGHKVSITGSVNIGTWCGQRNRPASEFFPIGTNDVDARMKYYQSLQVAPGMES